MHELKITELTLMKYLIQTVGHHGFVRVSQIKTTSNSAIHKATGLTVPGHSMTLPGTIPETPISHEWEPVAGTASGDHSRWERPRRWLRESRCQSENVRISISAYNINIYLNETLST